MLTCSWEIGALGVIFLHFFAFFFFQLNETLSSFFC